MNASIQALAQAIPLCRSADRFKLSQQLKRLKQLSGEQRDQAEQQLTHAIQASIQQVATRTAALHQAENRCSKTVRGLHQ